MKVYFSILGLVTVLMGLYGFVLPFLFSAHYSELVFLGWAVIGFSIPMSWYWLKSIYKGVTKYFGE